jgi:beta-lactamase regulating signal transducer with metallopeptidase domain
MQINLIAVKISIVRVACNEGGRAKENTKKTQMIKNKNHRQGPRRERKRLEFVVVVVVVVAP